MTLELTEEQKKAGWQVKQLGDVTECFDNLRRPIKGAERIPGPYPYYGASGVVDYVDGYVIDGDYLLIAEDGENLRSRSTPIAFIAKGKSWVNNHAHILRGKTYEDTKYLEYVLSRTDISPYITGSTMPKLNQRVMNRIEIAWPPESERNRIAEILGSIDDKIEVNSRLLDSLNELGNALVQKIITESSETAPLSEIAEIVMGQSPAGASLNEDGEGTVFYQGRRDFGFRYPTARVFTTAPSRMAKAEDILLSVRAPVGDLNRTDEECCVGRGVAAIRANDGNTSQLFYLLKNSPQLWAPFEGEGTIFSSINRKQVQGLKIPVVPPTDEFLEIEAAVKSLTDENISLAETRDLLIRQLIG